MRTLDLKQFAHKYSGTYLADIPAINDRAARTALTELFNQFAQLYPELADEVPSHQAAQMLEDVLASIDGYQRLRNVVRTACMRKLEDAGLPADIYVTRAELDKRAFAEMIDEAAGYLATAFAATFDDGEETDGPTLLTHSLSVNADDSSIYTVEAMVCVNGPTVYVTYSSSDDLIKFTYAAGMTSLIEIETDGVLCGTGSDSPLRAALIEYAECNC